MDKQGKRGDSWNENWRREPRRQLRSVQRSRIPKTMVSWMPLSGTDWKEGVGKKTVLVWGVVWKETYEIGKT